MNNPYIDLYKSSEIDAGFGSKSRFGMDKKK